MYSQIARPYIPGMLFSLLMVWYWSKYLFDQEINHKNKNLIGYSISSALCAYTHHFALLFAALVGLTGLFFLTKDTWKKYILAGITIFILYIPHLNIFFYQLNKGGLGGPDGWLGAPDPGWFSGYLKYIFHYSYWMYALLLFLLSLSIYFYSKEIKTKQKFRIIALSWFLMIFFIEYYYSLLVNPIIQYSTLIFVFPFFLIFLFSLFAELTRLIKVLAVFAILLTGTLTLTLTRKHFQVFYKQPYQEQIINTYKCLDLIKDENNATIELLIPPYYRDYYFKKYNRKFDFIFYNSFDKKPDSKSFRKFVHDQTTEYFISGNLPLEYLQIIKEKYPYMIINEEGFTYTLRCFSKNKSQKELNEKIIFPGSNNFRNDLLSMDSTQEYSEALTYKLKDVIGKGYTVVNIRTTIKALDSAANPLSVINIADKEETLVWAGAEYSWFNNDPKDFNKVYLSHLLWAGNFKKHPDAEIRIFVWNRNKKRIQINNINIETTEKNSFIFGLYEPLN